MSHTLLYLQRCRFTSCHMQGLTNGIREASDPGALKQLLSSTRLVLRIFFSMNNPGLTEVGGPLSSWSNFSLSACWVPVQGWILYHRQRAHNGLACQDIEKHAGRAVPWC